MPVRSGGEMKTRVLIVEDEMIVASNARRMLEEIGHEVVAIATSGEDAVTMALKLSPDVILMDIMLSGDLDGIRATEKIVERADIPVVYLSAYTDEKTLARAKVTEPFGYITKPFQQEDLRAAIEVALYKHRMESQLRESELQHRQLFRLAPVGIFYYMPDSSLSDCNDQFARFLGVPAEILLKKDVRTLLGKSLETALLAPFGGGQGVFEGSCTLPGGQAPMWIMARTSPLLDAKGRVKGAIGVLEDVTALRRTEEGLVRLAKLESFVADISMILAGATRNTIATALQRILEATGKFAQVDRVFVHIFENSGPVIRDVYEWSAAGRASQKKAFAGLGMDKFTWTMQRFRENEPICVLHTGSLPLAATPERELWQSFGVRSLLLVPLTLHAAPLGAIGFTMEQGEKMWTGDNIRLLRMLAQHIVNVLARLKAEEAWMASEERYHVLVESLNDVVFALDGKGYFTYLSPGIEELTGYAREDLLGEPFSRFVHPLERDQVAANWTRVRQGRAGSFECRILTKEGSIRQFRVSGRNVYLGTEVTGVTGIMTDVSQRMQAEEALKQSEERYRKLWEDSTDGLVLIDAETGGIIDCNREFASMAGRTKEQLCTMKIWEIRPAGIREAARRKFLEIKEKGTGGSAELNLLTPDGTEVRIDFKSSLLTMADETVIQSRCRRVP